MKSSFVAVLAVCLLGCASHGPVEIDASKFKNYGTFPLQHTVYVGSDSTFHYFAWSNAKRGGQWKVLKSTMPFRTEWPNDGTRQAFIAKDDEGKWQPLVLHP